MSKLIGNCANYPDANYPAANYPAQSCYLAIKSSGLFMAMRNNKVVFVNEFASDCVWALQTDFTKGSVVFYNVNAERFLAVEGCNGVYTVIGTDTPKFNSEFVRSNSDGYATFKYATATQFTLCKFQEASGARASMAPLNVDGTINAISLMELAPVNKKVHIEYYLA